MYICQLAGSFLSTVPFEVKSERQAANRVRGGNASRAAWRTCLRFRFFHQEEPHKPVEACDFDKHLTWKSTLQLRAGIHSAHFFPSLLSWHPRRSPDPPGSRIAVAATGALDLVGASIVEL